MLSKYNLTREIMEELTSKVHGNKKTSIMYSDIQSSTIPPSKAKQASRVKQNVYRRKETPNISKGSDTKLHNENSNHILVVLTGTDVGLEHTISELTKAKKHGISFDVALSENAEKILDINYLKQHLQPNRIYTEKDKLIADNIVQNVCGIIVPMITQNTVTKLALGIQDTFVLSVLWQGLWYGKPVFMDFANAVQYRGTQSQRPMLQKIIEDYIKKLIKMGVQEVKKSDYINALLKSLNINNKDVNHSKKDGLNLPNESNASNNKKVVITERDILELGDQGGELYVPVGTIVTPLAYDTAKKLGINIVKK